MIGRPAHGVAEPLVRHLVRVRIAEDPLTAVARGTGAVLEELDAVKDILEGSDED